MKPVNSVLYVRLPDGTFRQASVQEVMEHPAARAPLPRDAGYPRTYLEPETEPGWFRYAVTHTEHRVPVRDLRPGDVVTAKSLQEHVGYLIPRGTPNLTAWAVTREGDALVADFRAGRTIHRLRFYYRNDPLVTVVHRHPRPT